MTPNEQRLVDRLTKECYFEDLSVERESNREYDIVLKGRYGKNARYMAGCAFSAWLPLLAIKELTVWPSEEIANLTDYPDMAMAGDWSGVRDTDRDRIWYIFYRFVL